MKKYVKNRIINLSSCTFLFLFLISFTPFVHSQNDSLPYERYKHKIILYSDFGYTSAPFSLNYRFANDIKKLRYRNNYKQILGFGVHYKWFALRLSFALPGDAKSDEKYGATRYFGAGFNFTLKRYFWDVDFRSFGGYAIKNAIKWNPNLSPKQPNEIYENTSSFGFSVNMWHFNNRHFTMPCVLGKTGHYIKQVHTWYIKGTFNVYGIKNDFSPLIPEVLADSTNSKTQSNVYSGVDLGAIPGYAYVTRKNNWQIAGLLGLGIVLQNKNYNIGNTTRGFLGLAPRYDVRFIGGYSVPRYFLFLVTDIDNKSIRFDDLVYRQSFYSVKLVGGIRLDSKKEKRENKRKQKENS